MSDEKKEEISHAEMKVFVKENPKYRIKSILTIIVLVLILIGVIFFMGTILPEFFVFIIFILILSLPIILLLRQKIYDFVPIFIKDSLLEIDNENEDEKKPVNISRKYKQILAIIFISLLFIGSINYLKKFNKEIGERKSITKFLGSFVCIVLAGITLLDIDNI
jgi:hypothetical protein